MCPQCRNEDNALPPASIAYIGHICMGSQWQASLLSSNVYSTAKQCAHDISSVCVCVCCSCQASCMLCLTFATDALMFVMDCASCHAAKLPYQSLISFAVTHVITAVRLLQCCKRWQASICRMGSVVCDLWCSCSATVGGCAQTKSLHPYAVATPFGLLTR